MTTPKVTTVYFKNERYYLHEGTGFKVPGVSAIKGMLPSPALAGWFRKFTATYCIDNLEMISLLAAQDESGAIDLVKNATQRHSRKAADRGTAVHFMAEQIMRDKLAGVKSSFQTTGDDMDYLRNFARFVKEFEVEPVAVERTVWSKEHDYAGTLDLLCHLKGYDGLYIVDYKSGQSGIYSDAGIQQTGYRWADSYIDDDGEFQSMPEVAGAFGMWLRPDGWGLYPLRTDEVMWGVFQHLREVYRYTVEVADTVVSKPVNANPLKKVWRGNR